MWWQLAHTVFLGSSRMECSKEIITPTMWELIFTIATRKTLPCSQTWASSVSGRLLPGLGFSRQDLKQSQMKKACNSMMMSSMSSSNTVSSPLSPCPTLKCLSNWPRKMADSWVGTRWMPSSSLRKLSLNATRTRSSTGWPSMKSTTRWITTMTSLAGPTQGPILATMIILRKPCISVDIIPWWLQPWRSKSARKSIQTSSSETWFPWCPSILTLAVRRMSFWPIKPCTTAGSSVMCKSEVITQPMPSRCLNAKASRFQLQRKTRLS